MEEEIIIVENEIKSLVGSDPDTEKILEDANIALNDARAALLDRNAPAVERALGRAITALVEANPTTEVRSSELESISTKMTNKQHRNYDEIDANELLNDEIDFVDLTESEWLESKGIC